MTTRQGRAGPHLATLSSEVCNKKMSVQFELIIITNDEMPTFRYGPVYSSSAPLSFEARCRCMVAQSVVIPTNPQEPHVRIRIAIHCPPCLSDSYAAFETLLARRPSVNGKIRVQSLDQDCSIWKLTKLPIAYLLLRHLPDGSRCRTE